MKRMLFVAIIVLLPMIAVFGQETGVKKLVYSVPDLNGRAVLLQRPEVSGDVAMKQDGKTLVVKVVVDKNGDVVSAKCSADC